MNTSSLETVKSMLETSIKLLNHATVVETSFTEYSEPRCEECGEHGCEESDSSPSYHQQLELENAKLKSNVAYLENEKKALSKQASEWEEKWHNLFDQYMALKRSTETKGAEA